MLKTDYEDNAVKEGGLNLVNARKYLGGVSATKMYALVKSGEIQAYTIGNRKYVTKAELDKFIENQKEL
tara:strand:- start:395 stop:601 length:207 start_codon:yes stop_codon:yes gene_type:complete